MVSTEIERYYGGIVAARRLNAPSYDEAAKDMGRAYLPVLFIS